MIKVDSKFAKTISKAKEFDASACLNCGVCSAVCPMGINMLPRQLFHYALLGAKEKVLENQETIFSCLLCRMCEENCPADVTIAENVRTIRGYINREVFGLSRN